MRQDINLNSTAWCDVVFEGKNKEYGAYQMRQTSSRRHLVAFGVMVFFTATIAFLPTLLNAVTPVKDRIEGITEVTTISDVEFEDDKVKDIVEPLAPPPPPVQLKQTLAFAPPTIVETVDPEKEMLSQSELNKNKHIQISTVTNTDGVLKGGVDPADVLIDNRAVIEAPVETVLDVVEFMPQYPGGDKEMMRFLSTSIKYPTLAAENGIEGKVIVRFVVGKDGGISDVKVLRTVDPSLDKEAMRVVKAMPRWIAGKQNGRSVAVYYTLPVTFKLQK